MKQPDLMNYIEASGTGEPEVLRLTRGPLPQPKHDEVLLRVLAAGINYPDVIQRKGLYPPPPNASPVLGLEVAGVVVARGWAVTGINLGDRVCGLTNGGGYAEYCAVPAAQCLRWPAGYDAIHAAALPETYFTVWANLFELGRLSRGESVLIHGGTSGIGVTAIQLAHEFGSPVYATAGSWVKCEACLELGALAVINYREEDFAKRIADLTGGQGVHVVIDIVGGPYTMRNLRCLTIGGRLIQIGIIHGSKVPDFDLMPVMARRLIVTGSTMRPRTTSEKSLIARALLEKVWPVLEAGRCGPLIHDVFPLGEAEAAHRMMEQSIHIGKIVLKVAD